MTITIKGIKHQVAENLGFQHSTGMYAKEVKTEKHGRQIAVKPPGGSWRFWTNLDRIKPLLKSK